MSVIVLLLVPVALKISENGESLVENQTSMMYPAALAFHLLLLVCVPAPSWACSLTLMIPAPLLLPTGP